MTSTGSTGTTARPGLTQGARGSLLALVGSAHPGPCVAVTAATGLLAASARVSAPAGAAVTAAVLAGQLTIGWGNDLADLARDRAVGRTDKPLAAGRLPLRTVRVALAVALVACVALSCAAGWRSALVHLPLVVGMGHAYNLGLKATAWSWTPYAVAFGALPAVVSLAGAHPDRPAWWLLAAGATLGVGAHLLNALPDLADDAATGVQGLPHRLGERRSRVLAVLLLLAASVLTALGPAGAPAAWALGALGLVVVLAGLALAGRGRAPFRAAMLIALVDVVLLVASR